MSAIQRCHSGLTWRRLSTGSVNFLTRLRQRPCLADWLAVETHTYDVEPEVEAFDLSMIFQAAKMQREGKIKALGLCSS